MLNVNEVSVGGMVFTDPELRTSNTGELYCRFNVGTSEEFVAADGELQNRVNWHRCIVENELAEALVATCEKGTYIYIKGKSRSQFIEDGAGMRKELTETVVKDFQVVSGGKDLPIDLNAVLTQSISDRENRSDTEDIPH